VLTVVLVFGAAGGLVEDRLTMVVLLLTALPVTAYLFRDDVTPARLRDAALLGCPILLLPLWVS
jgi:hypothetical protein